MTVQPSSPALEEASEELIARGFTKVFGREASWNGYIEEGDFENRHLVAVRVELPQDFPFALPVVKLRKSTDHRWYAHIDRAGAICTAPPADYLIDASRPAAIIRDVLNRAKAAIFPASSDAHDQDLLAEFSAYWPSDPEVRAIRSIIPSSGGGSGVIFNAYSLRPAYSLLAPSEAAALSFGRATGARLQNGFPSYHLLLDTAFLPPRYEDVLTFGDFQDLLRLHCENDTFSEWQVWLRRVGVPVIILASAPLGHGGSIQFAVKVTPSKKSKALVEKLRSAKRKARLLRAVQDDPVVRLAVERMDAAYTIERGGGDLALLEKCVAVIGCGSVGSHIAVALADMGVGGLTLIDPETLSPANIHRHVLGAGDIGFSKCAALAGIIRRKHPNVTVKAYHKRVEDALQKVRAEADLVVIALGDETMELRLNDALLSPETLRVHAWLEPLGLGGHVLASGLPAGPGCLRCLYRTAPDHGLLSQASLVEPGQRFQRSLAGCAGTFTPYGILDAQRAAQEACREVARLLGTTAPAARLTSWITSTKAFIDGNFRLSPRGRTILEGQSVVNQDFARRDCSVCGAFHL